MRPALLITQLAGIAPHLSSLFCYDGLLTDRRGNGVQPGEKKVYKGVFLLPNALTTGALFAGFRNNFV